MKKLVTILMLVLLIGGLSISLQGISGVNEEVQAASIKLNKTSLSIDIGKSSTLRVVGTKNKVKWSSSNKNVVTVTSKGKITAKRAGTSTISAKVGKKTLKCKVTVKEQFSASKATKNISVVLQDTGRGVVAILKNNNKVTISVEAKMAYYSNGKMIDTASDSNYAFESGAECALFFHSPQDSDYNDVDYDDYKITLSVEQGTNLICNSKKISVNADFGSDNVSAEITNNSGKDFEYVVVSVVFYDVNGEAIGYDYHFVDCKTSGSTDYTTFDFPYGDYYETIRPDSYKVYVNSAYKYKFMS